jgi:hypothetical protein
LPYDNFAPDRHFSFSKAKQEVGFLRFFFTALTQEFCFQIFQRKRSSGQLEVFRVFNAFSAEISFWKTRFQYTTMVEILNFNSSDEDDEVTDSSANANGCSICKQKLY